MWARTTVTPGAAEAGAPATTIKEGPSSVPCKFVISANVPPGQQLFVVSLKIGVVDLVIGGTEDIATFMKEHAVPAGFPVALVLRNPGPKPVVLDTSLIPIRS
jgi:hypothetical protein